MLVTKPNEKDPKLKSIEILEVFMLSFVPCCLIPFTLKGKKYISPSYWVIYITGNAKETLNELNHFCLKMNKFQTSEPAERQHNHVTIFSGIPFHEVLLLFLNLVVMCVHRLKPDCVLELAEGMRPPEPEPEVVSEETEEDKKERKSSTSSSSSSSSSSDDEKDEEKKKKKKEKKEKKAKAAEAVAEAVATTEVAAEVEAEVEEKKEEVEDKKEEVAEKKDEVEEKKDDATMVLSGDGGTTVSKVFVSEQRSYTHQSSSSEEKGVPEQVFGQDISVFTTSETSSSVTTTTRVVSSKQVFTTSSTTQRLITSEGTTIEAIENGESEKVKYVCYQLLL